MALAPYKPWLVVERRREIRRAVTIGAGTVLYLVFLIGTTRIKPQWDRSNP